MQSPKRSVECDADVKRTNYGIDPTEGLTVVLISVKACNIKQNCLYRKQARQKVSSKEAK
jgi:hypothetical protein